MSHSSIFLSFLVLPFLLIQHQSCSPKTSSEKKTETSKTYLVSGTITQTQSYCGGARPPEDLLKKMQSPRPYPGKKIYFRKGQNNSLDMISLKEAISDSTGHFQVNLASGTYCIVEEDQVKELDMAGFKKKYLNQYLVADESCLKQWWSKCFMTVEVGATDKTDLNINFHFPCFTKGLPCVKYTGPLPQ
jgi:hypothetical protein